MEFSSLQELYNRITPALRCKQREMVRSGLNYIKQEDIWNYLKEVKWKSATNLSLYEMVSDVLNTDSNLIDAYLKKKIQSTERTVYFDE